MNSTEVVLTIIMVATVAITAVTTKYRQDVGAETQVQLGTKKGLVVLLSGLVVTPLWVIFGFMEGYWQIIVLVSVNFFAQLYFSTKGAMVQARKKEEA